MQKGSFDLIFFLVIVLILIVTMIVFVISIIYLYKRKQVIFGENLEALRVKYEKAILSTRLEIQENTFEHISKEIHDNINLSLTLAKLHLNTLLDNPDQIHIKIENSVNLLSKSIDDLRDISKTLSPDIFMSQGFIHSVESEIYRIKQASKMDIEFKVSGEPIYMNSQKELIAFRIIQEAFNNIIKHSLSSTAYLSLNFEADELIINIMDTGKGFDTLLPLGKSQAGLKNMETRVNILGGTMMLKSEIGKGTKLVFNIPYITHEN